MTGRRTFGMVMTVATAVLALGTLCREADAVGVRTWTGLSDNWVFSDPTNWDGNTPIANGDLLSFQGIHEDTLRNDIPGLTLTRLTFVDGFFTITGDPIQVDDIVANENGGYNTISADLSGIGRTLVGDGSVLAISGSNTFTGQVDVAGGLVANSDKALGSTAGATRILPGGSLEFSGRDLGVEPIIIETDAGPLTDRGCSVYNGGGASFLRNVKTSGASCIQNLAAISYPN
jgi:autotransporter-associated beta strand protein